MGEYIVTLIQSERVRTSTVTAASVEEAALAVQVLKKDPIGACYTVLRTDVREGPSTVQVVSGRVRVMQD